MARLRKSRAEVKALIARMKGKGYVVVEDKGGYDNLSLLLSKGPVRVRIIHTNNGWYESVLEGEYIR